MTEDNCGGFDDLVANKHISGVELVWVVLSVGAISKQAQARLTPSRGPSPQRALQMVVRLIMTGSVRSLDVV